MKRPLASLHSSHLSEQVPLYEIEANSPRHPRLLSFGILALISAVPIAFAIYRINAAWSEQPEKAVQLVGGLFAILAALPPAIYLLVRRGAAKLSDLGLIVIGTVSTLLVACYLFWASFYVVFPADIFIWSESDFVNDILKFRQGYPIFTAEVNNESFTYVPGTQLVTYFFAWLAGQPTSVPTYRMIQVGYTLLSAIVAFLCCRRLVKSSFSDEQQVSHSAVWGVVWLTGLFLIATNTITNSFSHLLHNDALAQLITVTAYWLLLEYDATKDKRILWLMALIPAVGFWVKQSLIIWAALYCAYLVIFAQPRSFKRLLGFGIAAFGGIMISFAIGYALWAENFTYWVFTVLGKHGVSPLRSFKHLLDIWPYFAVGLLGGAVLLQASGVRKLLGPWMIWLTLISIETYTSGVAWMLNHIGPGCLIAGVWFWAALSGIWTKVVDTEIKTSGANEWLRAGVCLAVICLLFSGLGIVRVPMQPFNKDAYRYAKEIENELLGNCLERTRLVMGPGVIIVKV